MGLAWDVADMGVGMIEKCLDVLPVIIMVESFLAAVPLAFYHRYGSALYWFAAGLLNLAVIYGIRRFG